MSDDNPHNDSWNDAPSGDAFEMDEEAVYTPDPDEESYEQDWDDEIDDPSSEEDFDLTEDDVDASFYEPPEPPITDAELEPDEPPESDGNWWRENWWRLAIVILLVLAIIFLLARACTGKTEKPMPTPVAEITRPALPTFTPTVAALPTTELESGGEAPTDGELVTTPAESPATQPPVATTAPPAATGKFTIGQTVVVTGTGKDKLSFRAGPGTDYKRVRVVKDGVKLTVIGGPQEADGFTWWQLKAPNGQVGWAVEDYLKPLQ
jgi:hypothetical protein